MAKSFDVGETFSGVDYEKGLEAVEALRPLAPAGATLAQMALRWILMFPEVTCAIPGSKRASQAEENIAAAGLPALVRENDGRHRRHLRPPRARASASAVVMRQARAAANRLPRRPSL